MIEMGLDKISQTKKTNRMMWKSLRKYTSF